MRATISFSTLALILSLAPASAMCGGSSGQSAGQAQMCGRPGQSPQAEDPFGSKSNKPQQQTTGMGMCPCCKGMASMGGMKMDSDDPHKGMDMTPKQ